MRANHLVLIAGVGLLACGAYLLVPPPAGTPHRQQVEAEVAVPWQTQDANPVSTSPLAAETAQNPTCSASAAPPADYASVQFTGDGVAQYGYRGISGDGNWDLLTQRNMVHWHGSADPGQPGNVIIAFHREPSFRYINQLGAGQTITIQDRACHNYVYVVEPSYPQLLWPSEVTQLALYTPGRVLTLVTCNPWYVDTQRYVWRADLSSVDGTPVALPVGAR